MSELKPAKKVISWLISQGIISTQKEFGERIGVTNRSYLSQLVSHPTLEFVDHICALSSRLNRDFILTGEGDMLREAEPAAVVNYTDGVPYYDEDFMLGFDELDAPSSENPAFLVRMPGYERATLWCNASGHSMEPEINNGDIIALQRIDDISFLPFGDVYGIITTNGFRTIKRLGRSSTPGFYRLIPTNKTYDEQEIPISKIAIVYRVMGAMKSF